MNLNDLLGMRLEDAQNLLRAQGEEAKIVLSRAPRTERDAGTLRVVRVRPGELTVCAFLDGVPEK